MRCGAYEQGDLARRYWGSAVAVHGDYESADTEPVRSRVHRAPLQVEAPAPRSTGARALLEALIDQALGELHLPLDRRGNRRAVQDAAGWILDPPDPEAVRAGITFAGACAYLGLEPDRILRIAQARRASLEVLEVDEKTARAQVKAAAAPKPPADRPWSSGLQSSMRAALRDIARAVEARLEDGRRARLEDAHQAALHARAAAQRAALPQERAQHRPRLPMSWGGLFWVYDPAGDIFEVVDRMPGFVMVRRVGDRVQHAVPAPAWRKFGAHAV